MENQTDNLIISDDGTTRRFPAIDNPMIKISGCLFMGEGDGMMAFLMAVGAQIDSPKKPS